jgi:hypothetical protein
MSTIVHYKAGKGPNRDGTSLASKYAAKKMGFTSMLEDAQAGDPRMKALVQRSTDMALKKREMSPGDMQGVPVLNNLSIAYAAEDLIGLELFPVVPVEAMSAQFNVWERRDRLQKPKTKGRGQRGDANEINRRLSTSTYSVKDDQLKGVVEAQVILNSPQPLNELLQLQEDVNHDLALNREREIAEMVTDPDNYSASNVMTLTGDDKWNTDTATILANILTAKAAMWPGRGNTRLVAATSLEVWNQIALNTGLLGMLGMNERGAVSPAAFLEITGLDGLLVSDARTDTANIGQTADYERIWGNAFVIAHVSDAPMQRNASLGYTFRWTGTGASAATAPGFVNGVFQQLWFDPKEGPIGSWTYKRSHFEDRKIVAADTAFLINTPI